MYERLADSTLRELRALRRKAKDENYILDMNAQVKIEVCYEEAFNPLEGMAAARDAALGRTKK